MLKKLIFVLAIASALIGCQKKDAPKGSEAHIENVTSAIDDDALTNAQDAPGDWTSYGLNYKEDRFSPLTQINKDNVSQLSLAWSTDLGTNRGIEATPLVVDGIMFLSGPWSVIYALDTRSGKILWTYDPEVPKQTGLKACCDVVNRGIAMYKGNIFAGTLDGRLVSIKASTGKLNWSVITVDTARAYTITGAPRVYDGKVIIGNSGADLGVRGYVTAYDAEDGKEAWRFWTVPGDPKKGFESKAMEDAAKTWKGEWWKIGGGGTAWDGFAYDPALGLVYIGTGNGSPWNREIRSPGGGDNLFLSSIVAVDVKTGEYKWHYQTTPGETWDYTAVQQMILADMKIGGKDRKVIMQAPKNGFFYVLDRETGELLKADAYTYVNWATHVDLKTGRPVETPNSRYEKFNKLVSPSPIGGHNWQAMAYNPVTKLVYIPSRELSLTHGNRSDFKYDPMTWNTGSNPDETKKTIDDPKAHKMEGRLIAWDPVAGKEVWRSAGASIWDAGVLTTSDLVFQGNAQGKFSAFDAKTGKKVWETDLKSGIIAPPVTYLVDGVQYVTVAVGWGGVMGLWSKYTETIQPGRIFTFKIGGKGKMPALIPAELKSKLNVAVSATPAQLSEGAKLFKVNCSDCHDLQGGGTIPNLTYSKPEIMNMIDDIVRKGIFLPKGMPNFGNRFTAQQVKNIQQYIYAEAKKK
ncbi:PQQ-dependent dehydrogenase, methanol/ethanol family [Aquirufa antheringensis]|jgi:quinohemoprotein ethanol dehydrogenase|uniref:PQQ-dependent dehydrogenase, methanol/ethanol family n=1 Tax=Aquirufa antheringensis TaxID=2516559 RepID=A0A4Q9BGX4_9BACT|nr:PQQ-dependent dehydrogenase, methanol/ethanol family [Aquirufa antheringensis]MCZ2484304.1 PQQ-dependent dehydrogenase, methanol/ethanol family [Aquirufa antheringensis]MCZ2487827.1 PQQ-dependent dehydrogenase, methanol/ethanol family [Aquirufa antheringensis]MCZ2489348.1 PQQ-dependent dehydrogenase, methanol/ethanol family [Aquirufa antheringensis]TBH74488.1 PQQ-dependent dehydrogenase, methanol/ethanol family [Aquirufa antheringensis]